jgi:hypothetical protein
MWGLYHFGIGPFLFANFQIANDKDINHAGKTFRYRPIITCIHFKMIGISSAMVVSQQFRLNSSGF